MKTVIYSSIKDWVVVFKSFKDSIYAICYKIYVK